MNLIYENGCKMKIPFDLKYQPQIESGEYKVETENGHNVRIICWDRHSGHTMDILALVENGKTEDVVEDLRYYDRFGGCGAENDCWKLVIITPDPELTEFEEAVRDFAAEVCGYRFEDNAGIRHCAHELLIAARKDAAKSLPKWKKPKTGEPGCYTCCLDYDGDNGFGLFTHRGFVSVIELCEKLASEE